MDAKENEKSNEETNHLNRSRSLKSKQLVRSQAIRETQSPPRALSPAHPEVSISKVNSTNATPPNVTPPNVTPPHVASPNVASSKVEQVMDERTVNVSDNSSLVGVRCSNTINSSDSKNSDNDDMKKKLPVEIQITSGGWDEAHPERHRPRRWHSDVSRDLLSNNPRVSCVCGTCAACVYCRGRRRRYCPTKQDSGIVCSDDCGDCSDNEAGSNNDVMRKASSLDVDDQYCRCPERKERPKNMTLSRNDSDDRNEPTGPELVAFIKDTLNKNVRDRMALLKIERELHALVNDTGRCIVRFPVMTSYGRMLVHRCAALFQLSHHLDQNNKTCVLVSKSGTCGGRIPCTSFRQWCTATFPPSPLGPDAPHAKSILKRDTHSLDEPGTGSLSSNRSKSLEQREREYEKVRRRIFSSQDESQWPWLSTGPIKLLTPEGGRNKLLKVHSLEGSPGAGGGSWRGSRGPVSKSHSFGGYTQPSHAPRLLSRQGDLASSSWRLSPSSSGYKTLSLRSTDSITPSPTGGGSPEPTAGSGNNGGPSGGTSVSSVGGNTGAVGGTTDGSQLVWCVTDLSAVPAGAMLIHPQTGRPLTNSDGSVYHFDPANPPVLYDPGTQHDDQQKVDSNNERRRGRLEKQHSFVDNECECQPSEECRHKCCNDCRRHDTPQQRNTADKESNTKPESPPYTQNNVQPEPTNQQPVYEQPTNQKAEYEATNQRSPYDIQANQKPYEVPRSYEMANQNMAMMNMNKQMKNDGFELQYQQYPQGYRTDDLTSPQQLMNQYMPQDMNMQVMQQAKVAPLLPDPNMRPMSIANMPNMTNLVYPATMQQGYPYQCRVDPSMQMYQPVMQAEEHKIPTTHANETPYRMDAGCGLPAMDYNACGACEHAGAHSYNVPYGQVEVPQTVLPPYQVSNVLMPQPHLQPYPQYQEPVWAVQQPPKLLVPELCPTLPCYPPYGLLYPQVIPQPYPVCQPVYPVVEKQQEQRRNSFNSNRPSKRNSLSNSARTTPHLEEKVPYDDRNTVNNQNNEIAAKIQQIKNQMAQLNTREKEKKRDDWRRRNSGNGILGNCPVNNINGRVMNRGTSDDGHLSSAARAIVNSIRNMQAKNNYPEAAEAERRRNTLNVPLYAHHAVFRQMTPGTWCRRSPGPVHPVLNPPRRPHHPDTRNQRR